MLYEFESNITFATVTHPTARAALQWTDKIVFAFSYAFWDHWWLNDRRLSQCACRALNLGSSSPDFPEKVSCRPVAGGGYRSAALHALLAGGPTLALSQTIQNILRRHEPEPDRLKLPLFPVDVAAADSPLEMEFDVGLHIRTRTALSPPVLSPSLSPLHSRRALSLRALLVALSLAPLISSRSLYPRPSRRLPSHRTLSLPSLPIALSLSPPFPSPSLSPLPSHRALSLRALLVALSLAPLISSRSLYPRPSRRLPSRRPLSLPSLPVTLSLPPPFPSRSLSLSAPFPSPSLSPLPSRRALSLRALPVDLSPVALSPIALALFFALSRPGVFYQSK
ncbi:unnamed protein product [Closterium sp. NIES-64]|nr:unnamed protein product [Closterium sp. NIES-64]